MTFGQIFSSKTIAANYTSAQANARPYLGETLAPTLKKAGLDLSFVKGHKGVAISLAPCAFDAKAPIRERISVSKISAEMPFFRESYLLKEKDRQEILRAKDANDPYAQSAINFVYDDARDLIQGARVVRERMFWNVFANASGTPAITIQENGLSYVYDYDPNDEYVTNNVTTLSGTAVWSASATADPLKDITDMQEKIYALSGTKPTRAVMSLATYREMIGCTAFQNAVKAMYPAGYALTEQTAKRFLADAYGISLAVYNEKFRANDASKTLTQFVPDGVVAFLPDGIVGHMVMGTTPEEADMAQGEGDTSIVEGGIAVTINHRTNPVNVETIASEITLPSAERLGECGLLIV